MEAVFKSKFLKKYTDFRKPTHDLWKIDLLLKRIC